MFWLVQLLVPIGVTVVLPVLIVWIIFRTQINRDNKNAEIIIKAIESNSGIDADRLVEALGKRKKTPTELLQARLLRGCIFTFIGVAGAIFAGTMAYNMPEEHLQYPALIVTGISLAIGIAYLIVYFVTRKNLDKKEN